MGAIPDRSQVLISLEDELKPPVPGQPIATSNTLVLNDKFGLTITPPLDS